jgi:acetaldehyde dehydrogenase (acetylating)
LVDVALFAGIEPSSSGIALAKSSGFAVSAEGIDSILSLAPPVQLVADATTAKAHMRHAPLLASAGIDAIDLTPAAVGPTVVPVVNLAEHINAPNVNLVSCAAQATLPIVHAIASNCGLEYVETVTTISSRSAGPGTRQNIDEFATKTRLALIELSGALRAKAIAILNPADPPLSMTNTVYAICNDEVDEPQIRAAIEEMVGRVQIYVPGYRCLDLVIDGRKVTVYNEVIGAGDYLPTYSGNLDIITAAATAIAKQKAARFYQVVGWPEEVRETV